MIMFGNNQRSQIDLPCDHSIYRKRLSEKNVVNEDTIKCNECKQELKIKDNQFKSIKAYTKIKERVNVI
jgi:hypothetical protein